jgi:hypothetical protein
MATAGVSSLAGHAAWLAKDLFWVTRVGPFAYTFGALAVVSQLRNLAATGTEFAARTAATASEALRAVCTELAVLVWLSANLLWCVAELGSEDAHPHSWYQPKLRDGSHVISATSHERMVVAVQVFLGIASVLALLSLAEMLLRRLPSTPGAGGHEHGSGPGGAGAVGYSTIDGAARRTRKLELAWIVSWIWKDFFWAVGHGGEHSIYGVKVSRAARHGPAPPGVPADCLRAATGGGPNPGLRGVHRRRARRGHRPPAQLALGDAERYRARGVDCGQYAVDDWRAVV